LTARITSELTSTQVNLTYTVSKADHV